MFRSKRSSVFLVALLLGIAGCTRTFVAEDAVSNNRAFSDFANKQLLLNAARASFGYPMTFAAISSGQGQFNRNYQMGSTATFGRESGLKANPLFLQTYNLAPRVTLARNNNFSVNSLESHQFYESIQHPIEASDYRRFQDAGWPKALLSTLIIAQIRLEQNTWRDIERRAKERCQGYAKGERDKNDRKPVDGRELCRGWNSAISKLRARDCGVIDGQRETVVFFNAGHRYCSFYKFQMLLRALRILNYRIRGTESKINLKTSQVKEFLLNDSYIGREDKEKYIGSIPDQIERTVDISYSSSIVLEVPGLNNNGGEGVREIGAVRIRSPQQLLYYLGELIRAQHFVEDVFQPTILYGRNYREVEIFDVALGLRPGKRIAVSVADDMGRIIAIEETDPSQGDSQARTLQTFTLVRQLFTENTSREDLPQSSTILVTSSN